MDQQVPAQPISQPTIEPQPVVQPSIPPTSSNFKKLFLLLGIIILLVAIAGAAYLFRGSEKKEEVAKIAPSPVSTNTPIPDPIANWKTFNLENITFKYPDDYINSEHISTNSGMMIKEIDNSIIFVSLSKDSSGENEKFIKEIASDGGNIRIQDNSFAISLEAQGNPAITAYILSKDKLSLYSIAVSSESEVGIEALLNQILSTFKFTDQNQTAGVVTLTGNDITIVSAFGITTTRPKDFDVFIDSKNNVITYHTTSPKIPNNQIIEINIQDYDAKKSLIDWWNTSPINNVQGETFTKMTQVHGYEALQTHGKGQVEYDMYYIPNGAKLYSFLIADFDSVNNAKAREVLDSLQFTN